MKPIHYRITDPSRVRDILRMAFEAAGQLINGTQLELILRPIKSKRSLEANAAMWAMLTDISRQKQWVVNGVQTYLEPEDWKDILTAALDSELRVAQGVSGGMVLLGRRTSKMSVKQMSDLLELIQAFGAEHGIRFSAPKHVVEQWSTAA
ncbi:recombination protein NinB [uncultured Pseudomonas sp.]|uniref:recombination protein NinB n=1 Tax=uncultured Pseudomonas sp. TaxID=114707 RepID=UPI0025D745E9|nr:recombination protein NinB [uncultured Pseudomonas sp.]